MAVKKRGLGRGLDALLPRDKAGQEPGSAPGSNLDEIPLDLIQPGRYQPRTRFDEEPLAELAASIKAQGLMQPLVLRPLGQGRYELIAGERRWRAAQQAGLKKAPAVIKDVDNESALAMSLIENIQREDLNPLEEARALQRLLDEFKLTHQQVADAVGRSRSAVTNALRLMQLEPEVAELLAGGEIEMGHARALLALEGKAQVQAARTVAAKSLTVRQTEELVRDAGRSEPEGKPKPRGGKPAPGIDTMQLERALGELLGQKVQLRHTDKGKGRLVIGYNSLDELDGVLEKMGYRESAGD